MNKVKTSHSYCNHLKSICIEKVISHYLCSVHIYVETPKNLSKKEPLEPRFEFIQVVRIKMIREKLIVYASNTYFEVEKFLLMVI